MATRSAGSAIESEEEPRVPAGPGADANGTDADRLAEAAGERLADLEQQLRDAGDRLRDGARELASVASEQMRQRPLLAFGVAFLAGMTVARLLRR